MSLFNADGQLNTTEVDGSSYTGLYAADGSINIVVDDGTYFGIYHPCGALRVNSADDGEFLFDGSGAYYINRLLGNPAGGVPPESQAFPDASTTGHRETLDAPVANFSTSGGGTVESPEIVELVDCEEFFNVSHDNVIVRDCRATIFSVDANCDNVIVEYCTFTGDIALWNSTVNLNGNGTIFRYNDVSGGENGMSLADATGATVLENWFHDHATGGGLHADCIQVWTNGHTIEGNNFDVANVLELSSCITTNELEDAIIRGNRFSDRDGEAVALYLEGALGTVTGNVVEDNVFEGDGGIITNSLGTDLTVDNTFSGNTLNGAPYSP